jgi:hypothetical protein
MRLNTVAMYLNVAVALVFVAVLIIVVSHVRRLSATGRVSAGVESIGRSVQIYKDVHSEVPRSMVDLLAGSSHGMENVVAKLLTNRFGDIYVIDVDGTAVRIVGRTSVVWPFRNDAITNIIHFGDLR